MFNLFFNSISFRLLSRSQEIDLIPYVEAETNETNKSNAFALLGHEDNSEQSKACHPTAPVLSLLR